MHQTLPSLRHSVLVTRDRPHVEVIDREGEDWRGRRVADELAATPTLPSVHVTLPLAEVYADVLDRRPRLGPVEKPLACANRFA